MLYSSGQSILFRTLLFCAIALAVVASGEEPPTWVRHQRWAIANPPIQKRHDVSDHDRLQAQKLVAEAVTRQGEYNAYRFANPRRNTNKPKDSGAAASTLSQTSAKLVRPTWNVTVKAAAALLAEIDAAAELANGTLHRTHPQPKTLPRFDDSYGNTKRTGGAYWLGTIAHTGLAPMGSNSSYPVYRDVTNKLFAGGAKGDGITDDTAAINAAIAYGGNCGAGCASSSIKGTLVYFPPGTYLISSPIEALYYSQLVGDPNNLPIIKTSQQFIGLGAIESDVYIASANGGEWYIEQSNFYRQVRNFIIDIRGTTTSLSSALHWQVAQATSLTNVYIMASTAAGTDQRAIFTENGSGGFMSDCFISGGQYGLFGGNQQYTVRNFEFDSQTKISIALLWDWGWTWQGITISASPIGIQLINPLAPTGQQAGSVYIMDTLFDGVVTAVDATDLGTSILESSIITLDNIGVLNVVNLVLFSDGVRFNVPAVNTDFLIVGNYQTGGATGFGYNAGNLPLRPAVLTGPTFAFYQDSYFVKTRPQYADIAIGSIISVKDHGALGNGVHDDTAAIVAALALATTSNLIYFPAGSYIITSTITIPPNTRMTGEIWSQLVASGSYFANMNSPQPMVRVGAPGSIGTVEISDMLFTSIGALPGLVLMEWNVQAASQGSVGMWDSHFRVGGAYGTKLQVQQCPKTSTIQTGCIAASMMMHVTNSSNGYFENVWAWVADHDLDDPTSTMVTVAVARGMLIESLAGPTWLWGTASEHSMLYQYNFAGTSNVLAGMIQTESPYFQYSTVSQSPGPFSSSIGMFGNDPIFPDSTCTGTALICNFAWAVMITSSSNLTIAGAGLYSWFENYDQSVCVDAQNCQQRLVNDGGGNSGLYIWNLITIGAIEMVSNTETGEFVLAANNTQAIMHPFWSALAAYLEDYQPGSLVCADDDLSPGCQTAIECDNTIKFATLDQLQAAENTFPNPCMDYYALGVLETTLNTSLSTYASVNAGYDAVFGDYRSYVTQMVPGALGAFMADSTYQNPAGGPGNKYFQCTLTVPKQSPVTQQCPFNYASLNYRAFTIQYTLTNSTGFYAELSSTYGIQQSWTQLGNSGGQQMVCTRSSCGPVQQYKQGVPLAAASFTVPNPKDVITAALPKIGALQTAMLASDVNLGMGMWYGQADDILQVFSMPVIMITSSLASMATVKSIGQKVAKEMMIAKILLILGIILAFIPFLDEILAGVDLAALEGVFTMVSVVGYLALDIQQIISDPSSAPMAILGALTGGTGIRSEADFAKFASVRRGINPSDLAKIGDTFKNTDAEFQSVIAKKCLV